MGTLGFRRRIGLCALLLASTSGCAISYGDSAGNRHVIGLVDLAISPATANQALAGNVVAVTTIGALVSHNAQGNTLALGYASETVAAIKDNVLVLGNPLDIEKITKELKQ